MRRRIGLIPLWIFVAILLAGCSGAEAAVRKTVEEVANAAEAALNQGNLKTVEPFFATEAEGANPAGLEETWGALNGFASELGASDRVQFHSFDIDGVAVHESGGLARVTYQLHLSVIRNGQVIFGTRVTQDVALLKTTRGWRISGGDTPRLAETVGAWPPLGSR